MGNARQGEEVVEGSPEGLSEEETQKLPKTDDGEFKITVRKLELPVRPRGVLAE